MPGPSQPRFAHFESVKQNSLYDLYTRHAEVARDIHQDALRQFTGNRRLTVDLVRESPVVPDNPQGTINRLQQYDVVSVSSGVELGALVGNSGVSNREIANLYLRSFAELDMPVVVEAAGNDGLSARTGIARVSDFARNSLVVGEAHMGKGKPFVEEHSSRINPTLTADNPFNRGQRYQFYNVRPSLTGHEGLIQNWIIDREVAQAFEQFKTTDEAKGLDDVGLTNAYVKIENARYREFRMTEESRDKEIVEAFEQFKISEQARGLDEAGLADAYDKIRREKHQEYEKGEPTRARINAQVQGYLSKPETLHSQIMAELRQTEKIDRKGYVTGVDGTSFSAPEQAGYISGALYEQTRREARNRPILTKDEITTLAKMATVDTTLREGRTQPMSAMTNGAGQTFVEGGGHGVFRPDVFRKLLDEAYKRIETNPNIDRTPVTATMNSQLAPGQRGNEPIPLRTDLPEGQNMVIDRVRLDVGYNIDGLVPIGALLSTSGQNSFALSLQHATGIDTNFMGWSRHERGFGEIQRPGDSWQVRILSGQDVEMQNARITLYGYNQGGLMDQMMQYSREMTDKMAVSPAAAPAQMPAAPR